MYYRIIYALLVILCAAMLSSCAAPMHFQSGVSSFAYPNALEKKRYIILPGNKDVEANDLQFVEFTSYIQKILSEKGLEKAISLDSAEIAIFLQYGIGNPQTHQYSYAIPMWGQTGVSSSSTSGTLTTYGRAGTYSGTTTYTPTYGITVE